MNVLESLLKLIFNATHREPEGSAVAVQSSIAAAEVEEAREIATKRTAPIEAAGTDN